MSWRPREDVRWIEVDDGIVVYDSVSGRFADLNEPATLLWVVMDDADWDASAAERRLIEDLELPVEEARHLLAEFVRDLQRSLSPEAG